MRTENVWKGRKQKKKKKCIRKKRRSEQNIERKRETRDIQIRLLLVLVLPYLLGSICLLAKLHITYMNTDLILSSLLCRKIAKHAHLPRHPACYLSFSSLADSSSSSNNASIFCKEERPCRLILMTSLRCRSSREIIF